MIDPRNHNPFPKNQTEAVLLYIQKHGQIDFVSASNYLGVSRLAARISELKEKGWRFDKETETGKNRYGHTYQKKIYSNARRHG